MEELNIREKMVAPQFGDIITNGWASENNPTRVGYFVREGRRTGRMNPGRYFEVTDGAGKFWELPLDRDHKITVRPIALLSSAEAREEAERNAQGWHRAVEAICTIAGVSCALSASESVEAVRAALQSAEARAREAEGRAIDLARALTALRDAVAKNPTMQGREYVGLGIQVNNALSRQALGASHG